MRNILLNLTAIISLSSSSLSASDPQCPSPKEMGEIFKSVLKTPQFSFNFAKIFTTAVMQEVEKNNKLVSGFATSNSIEIDLPNLSLDTTGSTETASQCMYSSRGVKIFQLSIIGKNK